MPTPPIHLRAERLSSNKREPHGAIGFAQFCELFRQLRQRDPPPTSGGTTLKRTWSDTRAARRVALTARMTLNCRFVRRGSA